MKKRVEARGPIHTVNVTYVKHGAPIIPYYDGVIDILSCDAIHAVDLVRHLCGGDVVSIASDVRALDAAEANAFYALIKFSTGATGVLHANWACGKRFLNVEMHGQGISAYLDPDVLGKLYVDGDTVGESFDAAGCAKADTLWHRSGFYAENRHFINCIKANRQPCSSLADTVATMELVDRIYHSQIGV